MMAMPERPPAAQRPPVAELKGITKRFPGVVAVSGADFAICPGEVHGLVGENGAGKSTLMRVLAGVYPPDEGVIQLGGEPVVFTGPAQARSLGISMVFQDTRLAPDLTIAQNVWLGREPAAGAGLLRYGEMHRRTAEYLRRFGEDLDPATLVRDLSVAQKQMVEIIKALSAKARVLILDEPTSALDPTEVDNLFEILRDLRRSGAAIVFISHRLPEVLELADRITVMKDGEVAGTLPGAGATEDELVRMMVGRQVGVVFPPRAAGLPAEPLLRVERLTAEPHFRDISFAVRPGEIVGLAGVEGNGQREIARALFGLVPVGGGAVRLGGAPASVRSPRAAQAAGIVYVSNDRRQESLALPLSVRENAALPNLGPWSEWGVVRGRAERAGVQALIQRLAVKTPSMEQRIEFLSGGNQQKVALGRWLAAQPRVFILDEPTLGVDVAAKLDLYHHVRRLAQDGAAVLVVSSDLIELIGLTDRLLVVSHGRIVKELPSAEATEESVIGAAVTARKGKPAAAAPAGPPANGAAAPAGPPANGAAAPGGGGAATANGTAHGARPRPQTWVQRWYSPLLVGALLAALVALTAIRSPYFFTGLNLQSLALQSVSLALAALGQNLVILLGGVDLSIGPMMSLTTAIASYLIVKSAPVPLPAALGLALAAGAAVGILNGALIRYARIPDLIATLATFSIVQGMALVLRPGPGGLVARPFIKLMTASAGKFLPVAAILVLLLYVAAEFWLQRSRPGLWLLATGSHREAAFISGIPVDRVRVVAYVLSGIAAAAAGLFLAARIGSGDPQSGSAFSLGAITAVVVGGTSIFGGRGSLIGTLVGVLLVATMQNALNLLHVSAYFQYVWTGALTLLAVGLYSMRWGRRRTLHQGG